VDEGTATGDAEQVSKKCEMDKKRDFKELQGQLSTPVGSKRKWTAGGPS
jgi:hypothetical protein